MNAAAQGLCVGEVLESCAMHSALFKCCITILHNVSHNCDHTVGIDRTRMEQKRQ